MIHPETKFIANAERNGNGEQSINWTLVKQIFIIGRMTAIPYFFLLTNNQIHYEIYQRKIYSNRQSNVNICWD